MLRGDKRASPANLLSEQAYYVVTIFSSRFNIPATQPIGWKVLVIMSVNEIDIPFSGIFDMPQAILNKRAILLMFNLQ